MTLKRFVIVLDGQGDALFWRELLELVLAGASLDLDLLVLFEPWAMNSLCRHDSEIRAWQQVVDHELARVKVVERSGWYSGAPDWIETVCERQAASWRSERAEIFA